MAKLPDIKRILREDVPDAPDWVSQLIYPMNSLAENIYQALNKQLTFQENLACSIKTLEFTTPSTYSTDFTAIQIPSGLRRKATGLLLCQLAERGSNYTPLTGSPFINWVDINGGININYISGLTASKTYILTILIF